MNTSSVLKRAIYYSLLLLSKTPNTEKNATLFAKIISTVLPKKSGTLAYTSLIPVTDSSSAKILARFKEVNFAAKPQYYYEHHSIDYYRTEVRYSALVKNARMFGSSNLVLDSDGKALNDLYHRDVQHKLNHSDIAISSKINQHIFIQYRDGASRIDSGILMSGNFSHNYYHFVFEFLTKFSILGELRLPTTIPLLADNIVAAVPQLKGLMDLFNHEERDILYIKPGCIYPVEELYVLPSSNLIPPNYKKSSRPNYADCVFNSKSIDFLRNTVLPKKSTRHFSRRIFLSRKYASYRRKYNEEDVIAIFQRHRFDIVNPEQLTVREQAALFSNAEFIAGVTGAAFTNIAFCSPGCKILCILSARYEVSTFSTIAKYLNLDFQHWAVSDHQGEISAVHDDFEIDPICVEKVLIEFLAK